MAANPRDDGDTDRRASRARTLANVSFVDSRTRSTSREPDTTRTGVESETHATRTAVRRGGHGSEWVIDTGTLDGTPHEPVGTRRILKATRALLQVMTENTADGAAETAEVQETTEAETETEVEVETETETTTEETAVVDLEAAAEYETVAEDLAETVEEQQEQIDELSDMVMDLSARLADNDGVGVCPDCRGPVVKSGGLLRATKIKCTDCGRVYHEY